MNFTTHITECLLWPENRAIGVFKSQPSDFIVKEILDWDFKGQGEHIFLQIEKIGCNTAWVAKQLSKFYGVSMRDVSYSGLKDRHAVTTQYFSIRQPGVKPDSYNIPEHDEYRVVSHILHDKKLKRGNHKYNDFTVRLRDVVGDPDLIEQRLIFVRDNGCPNFFDSQRFGHENNNLQRLLLWVNNDIELRKRDEKSMVLSALRSSIFNRQLAQRVSDGSWQYVVSGDTVVLDGSNSHFVSEHIDSDIAHRASEKDLHPAGILVGEESEFVEKNESLKTLMRREHLKEKYRPLRLNVKNLNWKKEGDDYLITMRLPSGGYASAVLNHVFQLT